MGITEETVKELARVCCLALGDEEIAGYCRDLGSLEELASVLLPLSKSLQDWQGAIRCEALRQDICRPCPARETMLSSAPQAEDGYLVVPRAVEEVSE